MKKMSKGGGMMGIGKSNAKMYMEKQTGVTFLDVAEDEGRSPHRKLLISCIILKIYRYRSEAQDVCRNRSESSSGVPRDLHSRKHTCSNMAPCIHLYR